MGESLDLSLRAQQEWLFSFPGWTVAGGAGEAGWQRAPVTLSHHCALWPKASPFPGVISATTWDWGIFKDPFPFHFFFFFASKLLQHQR